MRPFFLYDARDRFRRNSAPASITEHFEHPGLSIRESFRSIALYRIGLATMIMLVVSAGLIVHKVPILNEARISRQAAAWLASLKGLAGIAGKIATGWLMQRFDPGNIGALTNCIAGIALILLIESIRTPMLIIVSMMTLGYAGVTGLQICAFLTGIYGGLRNFGAIFGVMPCIPAAIVAGGLLFRLGHHPNWENDLSVGSRPKAEVQALPTP